MLMQGTDGCSAAAPTLVPTCSGYGFEVNADQSASLANVLGNNGAVVTYTATSSAGVTASTTCTMAVVDTTPPVVTCAISAATAQCGGPDISVSATVRCVVPPSK